MISVARKVHGKLSRLLLLGLALGLVGCATAQMRYNILTYDDAIAESANQLLLLNAVRASQRYPMSFTSVGEIIGAPQIAGSLMGTMNFLNPIGLTTSSFTPNISTIGPGYSQFALGNLNNRDFMDAIRLPIPQKIIHSFQSSTWPDELLKLIYLQDIQLNSRQVEELHHRRRDRCARRSNERDARLCAILDEDISLFDLRCSGHFSNTEERLRQFKEDPNMYYNSAASYCHFFRFQILLRELRLLKSELPEFCPPPAEAAPKSEEKCQCPSCPICPKPAKSKKDGAKKCNGIQVRYRSALQMIQYLGELISAQHHAEPRFMPEVLIGYSLPNGGIESVRVPLFVVNRDLPGPERVAVAVRHEGHFYFIPQPEFGSSREARSLQALDLVLQTVRAATHREDMPKVPSFGIITK